MLLLPLRVLSEDIAMPTHLLIREQAGPTNSPHHLSLSLPLQAPTLPWPCRDPSYTTRKDHIYFPVLLPATVHCEVRGCQDQHEASGWELWPGWGRFGGSFSHSKLWAWLMTLANSPARCRKNSFAPLRLLLSISWKMCSRGGNRRKVFTPNSLTTLLLLQPHFESLGWSKDEAKNFC